MRRQTDDASFAAPPGPSVHRAAQVMESGPIRGASQDPKDSRLISRRNSGAHNGWPISRALVFLLLAAVAALAPPRASAQVKSNSATVTLNATLPTSITIVASPGNVNFALVRSGVATGSSPISITTTYVLPTSFGNLTEYAYFTTAAAALSDGAGDNIPSSSVSGSYNGGAYTAFTGASPYAAGSSITLFTQFIFFFFNGNGTRTDSLNLQISTVGLNLPAATYTGTLHIEAQMN